MASLSDAAARASTVPAVAPGHAPTTGERRGIWPAVVFVVVVLASVVLLGLAQAAGWIGATFGQWTGASDVRSLDVFPAGARLLGALAVGVLVTLAQRHVGGTHLLSASMASLEQAQILLALAGALMMMVIGNSLAHAFGIAGAASIIRFRTPVEDPRDVTVLFLAMALGMAVGLGAFAIAVVGTAFLCAFLVLLHELDATAGRAVKVRLVSTGVAFPLAHVHAVFEANGIPIETLESSSGKEAVMRFRGRLPPGEPLDALLQRLSAALMADGAGGLKEVSWDPAKAH
jgi:hypothetical protein